jgi:hypothetical protein
VGDGPAPGQREVAAHLDRVVVGDAGDLGGGHDPWHHAARDGDGHRSDTDPLRRHLRACLRGDAHRAGGRRRQRVQPKLEGRVARPVEDVASTEASSRSAGHRLLR